jgi:hypothetical protein
VPKESNVSQPESVAFSLDSSNLGGSVDVDSSQANQAYVARDRQMHSRERVNSWNRRSDNRLPSCNSNYLGDITVSKV